MKKILIVFAVAMMAILPSVNAQNWGIGGKFGSDNGLNIKKYQGGTALEGVFAIHKHGFSATGLYEWNKELGSGFNLYYGLGATLGYWDNDDDESELGLGIDGIIGIEWFIPNVPIALALDWMPQFQLIPETEFWAEGLSLSIKYVW